MQLIYSYDAAGNRTAEQIDGSVTTSTYNNLKQITGQSAGGAMVFSGTISEYATVTEETATGTGQARTCPSFRR